MRLDGPPYDDVPGTSAMTQNMTKTLNDEGTLSGPSVVAAWLWWAQKELNLQQTD